MVKSVQVVMCIASQLNLFKAQEPNADLDSALTQLRHVTLFLEDFPLAFLTEKHSRLKLSSFSGGAYVPVPRFLFL